MHTVGLGDLAAAARALMAVPEARRGLLLRRLMDEADLAERYRRTRGRAHPVFGNGTLMSAALARPQAGPVAPGDSDYLACLAQAIEGVLDRRGGARDRR
jgi:hypothetical protein